MRKTKPKADKTAVRSPGDWRTSDHDEIARRRSRAMEGSFSVLNTDARHPIFSNFRVESGSGLTYTVEIRDLKDRQFSCECVDFRINGLGTCKHVEAVLLHLASRSRRHLGTAQRDGSGRFEVVVDGCADTLRLLGDKGSVPRSVQRWFGPDRLCAEHAPEKVIEALRGLEDPRLRISQDVVPWLEERRRATERKQLRRAYEQNVQSGEWPVSETLVPLFPYQREGMLHLAFTERSLLADEMGLGKTIQAIAGAALLHRLGRARRVLVVTPASLKTEWEEQIRRFTPLAYQIVFGSRPRRLAAYDQAPFFTIVNYEQMVADAMDVNTRLVPDLVILDEAQRIKNWSTKTARSIKLLRSRYAFVLTGTPIENRIDELHSLMDFLNPSVLGPLFRFNRDFYEFDDRGRPVGYRNLDQLHARIKPYLLRRRKSEVETELPERTDHQRFVPMSDPQRKAYAGHEQHVSRLVNTALRRPLTKQEQDKLQRELAMMRMICDSNYILDPEDRTCPKLAELEKVLEECRANDTKVIIFSEWERMLELVRGLCQDLGLGCAWHTGSVPQQRRRAEINSFKSDPACRVFLSTDSGATGLNLQNASVVINCDLPWNPAKLEQRIARAWRKNQTKPVTVINLISEDTIEHRMLDTLATKQIVAESVLDRPGEVTSIAIRGGRQAMVDRLQSLVSPAARPSGATPLPPAVHAPTPPERPADPALAFACRARERVNGALVRCEERYPQIGAARVLVVVVERDPVQWREALAPLHAECFRDGPGDTSPASRLEVMDRATHEAVQHLIEAGVLTATVRATRPLLPEEGADGAPVLSEEARARTRACRDKAGHHLRLGRLLAPAGFEAEARTHLLETLQALGCALAIEKHLPEPPGVEEMLQPPWSQLWEDHLPVVSGFARATVDARTVIDSIGRVLGG